MAQAIFDYATSINIDANRTLFTSVSNSGIFRSEIGSPVFYYIEATPRLGYADEYDLIARDVMDLQYGRSAVAVKIPHDIVRAEGPNANAIPSVNIGSVNATGNVLQVNAAPGGFRKGDYLQIKHDISSADSEGLYSNELTDIGAMKVYQVMEDATPNASGVTTVTLNSALARSPAVAGLRIRINTADKNEILFKLIANEIPGVNTVPGNRAPLYSWAGNFSFREVL